MMLSDDDMMDLKSIAETAIQFNRRITLADCKDKFEIDAVLSMHSQLLVRKLKESPAIKISDYLSIGDANLLGTTESLLQLANRNSQSGYRVAKSILEYHEIESVAKFLENPNIMENSSLRSQLLECLGNDPACSHSSDQLKECVGREYERLLQRLLTSYSMRFETEAELRSKGKPKTPDIVFVVPMACSAALANPAHHSATGDRKSSDLMIVNWIDSKAMFADAETFAEHRAQFASYCSRYGPGMVIYWHGFHSALLRSEEVQREELLVCCCCPAARAWLFPGELAREVDQTS